jgi:CheY-like chemotaxis protein
MQEEMMVVSPLLSPHILVVDDDVAFRDLLSQVLEDAGYRVTCCGGGASAAAQLSEEGSCFAGISLVLLDQCMPAVTGLELARWLGVSHGPPVVMMSAFADAKLIQDAKRAGAVTLLQKPFRLANLMEAVRNNAPLNRSSS